jgi:hypothetical protein
LNFFADLILGAGKGLGIMQFLIGVEVGEILFSLDKKGALLAFLAL